MAQDNHCVNAPSAAQQSVDEEENESNSAGVSGRSEEDNDDGVGVVLEEEEGRAVVGRADKNSGTESSDDDYNDNEEEFSACGIIGGGQQESDDEDEVVNEDADNGDEYSADGEDLQKFIDEVVLETDAFAPSTRIFGVVTLWRNKRRKKHFFNDAFFSQKVFADELGLSLVTYLGLRGWSVNNCKKKGEIDIHYRRIYSCLSEQHGHPQLDPDIIGKYFHLVAFLDRVHKYLASPSAFAATRPLPKEPPLEEQINRAVTQETKSCQVQQAQTTKGKLNIVEIMGRNYSNKRNLQEHQHLLLAMSTLQVCFGPVKYKYKKKRKQNKKKTNNGEEEKRMNEKNEKRDRRHHLELEKLFGLVFKECSTRRELLVGLQDLLMYCKDGVTIQKNKQTLLSWLDTPTKILDLARSTNSNAVVLEGYGNFLWESLLKKFKQSSFDHHGRSMDRDRIIVQAVVFAYIKAIDHKLGVGVTTREVLLMGSCRKRKHQDAHLGVWDGGRKLVDNDDDDGGNSSSTSSTTIEDQVDAIPSILAASEEESLLLSDNESRVSGDTSSTISTTPAPDNNQQPPSNGSSDDTTWSIPYDSADRWADNDRICIATVNQMRRVTARLVIECPHCDILLYHRPIELYVAWDLHAHSHQFQVIQVDRTVSPPSLHSLRATFNVPDGGNWHRVPSYLVVARRGCSVFDRNFLPDVYKIDLAMIAQFIFKHGKNDPERSATMNPTGSPLLGSRYDFGNAGQATEPGSDSHRPKTLCCTQPLENYVDGKQIRRMIGKIVDAMCNCYHDLSKNVLGRSSTMSQRRFEEFASKLRHFLRAKHCVTEWITLQLLNLSHGQGGGLHKDISNDPREGYNHTMCFCLHFTDNVGDLWSLKIITGYRKKIGDWMSLPYGKLIPFVSALLTHTTEIDNGYKDILLRQYKGQYIPSVLPSWKDPKYLWLDDDMPYDINVLKVGVNVFVFKMKTSPTLSFWLSPALTGAHRLSRYTCFRGMVQLAIVAACQNSFENYFVVTQEMLNDMVKESTSLQLGRPVQDKYPGQTYCDTCALLFSQADQVDSGADFVGGNYSPPRYPPVSFDIRILFGSEDTSKVDLLVDELIKLIDSVNTILESLVLAVGRSTLEPLLNATSNRIREIRPGLELVPFRLLLFLEFCAHLNVGLTMGTEKIRNLLYPVSGTASHQLILKHLLADERFKDRDPGDLVDVTCSFLMSELSTTDRQVFMDEIEPMLCEVMPSEEYRWGGNDTFIKGQSLFWINEGGVPFVRSYGKESAWMPILPKTRKKK